MLIGLLRRVALGAAAVALAVAGAARADEPAAPETTPVPPAAVDPAEPSPDPAVTTTDQPATTTTAPAADAPVSRMAAALVVPPPLRAGCLDLGAGAVVAPGGTPVVLGPLDQASPARRLSEAAVAYPADGSVITISGATLAATSCGALRPRGSADVQSLSLFGGAITADKVSVTLGGSNSEGSSAVSGLRVNGEPVTVAPGERVDVADWGYLVALGGPRASSAEPGRLTVSALAVHVVTPHAGLAAGTVLSVPFARLTPPAPEEQPAKTEPTADQPERPARHLGPWLVARERTVTPDPRRRSGKVAPSPLTVTPPLGLTGYIFPVTGNVAYGDTYGAPRNDVSGGWHHGDDLFAALGTPVVALADGRLSRVGWARLGGWRLWLRDRLGNQYYYAHLAGYTAAVLRDKHVKAGQVIGFVGNTGDAFTTPPHLHFEIHPRSLLRMHYDGAVNPTSYLAGWRRISHVSAPRPARPPLPPGYAAEAKLVFRELLKARGLIRAAKTHKSHQRPEVTPQPAVRVAAAGGEDQSFRSKLPFVFMVSAAAIAALGGLMLGWRRRLERA